MEVLGKTLLVLGLVIAGFGAVLMLWGKVPFLGRLPGDIVIKRDNFVFYFPITTSILVSVILSLIFYLISKFR